MLGLGESCPPPQAPGGDMASPGHSLALVVGTPRGFTRFTMVPMLPNIEANGVIKRLRLLKRQLFCFNKTPKISFHFIVSLSTECGSIF